METKSNTILLTKKYNCRISVVKDDQVEKRLLWVEGGGQVKAQQNIANNNTLQVLIIDWLSKFYVETKTKN